MKRILILLMIFMTACNHYYKATLIHAPTDVGKAVIIDSLNHQKRYFILRNGNRAYFMKNPQISSDRKSIKSVLQNTSMDHRLHFLNGRKGKFRYGPKPASERNVLDEAHFYMLADTRITIGTHILPLNNIQKIEVIEKDESRTSRSAGIGFVAGLVSLVAWGWLLLIAVQSIF